MRWYQSGDVRAAEPLRQFVRGADQQFAAYVDKAGPVPEGHPGMGPCWVWTGRVTAAGYGQISENGRGQQAHRWAYERFVGPIPDGLEPDHLCRNTRCVNYERHLQLVTHQVNTLRGESPPAQYARRKHCSKGHEFTPENTFARGQGGRGCRTCDRARSRATYLKRKTQAPSI